MKPENELKIEDESIVDPIESNGSPWGNVRKSCNRSLQNQDEESEDRHQIR
jgi:hypothetical protein